MPNVQVERWSGGAVERWGVRSPLEQHVTACRWSSDLTHFFHSSSVIRLVTFVRMASSIILLTNLRFCDLSSVDKKKKVLFIQSKNVLKEVMGISIRKQSILHIKKYCFINILIYFSFPFFYFVYRITSY